MTATAALSPPRCECEKRSVMIEPTTCGHCGKEIREPGTLGRALRLAVYKHELHHGRERGLDARSDFRGLSAELGANPPVEALHAAVSTRSDELAEAA